MSMTVELDGTIYKKDGPLWVYYNKYQERDLVAIQPLSPALTEIVRLRERVAELEAGQQSVKRDVLAEGMWIGRGLPALAGWTDTEFQRRVENEAAKRYPDA
jgi:hypothetical protein